MRARAARLCMFPKRLLGCHVAAVMGAVAVGGSLISSSMQADAAGNAADVQAGASREQVMERQRQFDLMQSLLKPWVDSGTTALGQQGNLIGLGGADKQTQAIDALRTGPQFQALQKTGQNAILQNAAATGGLRGGNVNAALGQYDMSILSGLIDQQYGRLNGIATQGQNAAAGVGTAAVNTGAGNAQSIGEAAAAQAGGIMGGANAASGFIRNAVNAAGIYSGASSNMGARGYVASPPGTSGGYEMFAPGF